MRAFNRFNRNIMTIQKISKKPQPFPLQLSSWIVTSIFCSGICFSSLFDMEQAEKKKSRLHVFWESAWRRAKKRTPPSTKTEVRPRTRHENTRKRPKEADTLLPGLLRFHGKSFFKLGRFLSWFAKYTECENQPDWKSVCYTIILQRQLGKGKRNFFCTFSGDFQCLYPI